MNRSFRGRSISPLHVHVGAKTPVHLHVKPPKKKRMSRLELQERSCSALSCGRPGMRALTVSRSPSSNRSYKRSESIEHMENNSTWIPPPTNAATTKMTWEGGRHRLEIHPEMSGSTMMHLSELSDQEEPPPDIILENDSDSDYHQKMKSLQTEMEAIRAKVELKKSMRELVEKDTALKSTHESLKKKDMELSSYKECLLDSELENLKLKVSLSRQSSPERPSNLRERSLSNSFRDYDENQKREELLVMLSKVENESIAVMNCAQKVKASLKKLQKDRRFVSVHASQLLEAKDTFLEGLNQFESMNRSLRRLIRDQQLHQSTMGQTKEQCDHLQRKLIQLESANGVLRDQLQEQERMLNHSQQLHDEIGVKEGEIQTMQIRQEALEEQLKGHHEEHCQLQQTYTESKEHWYRDKESLKKGTKQLKDKLAQAQSKIHGLTDQLHEVNSELAHEKAMVMKLSHDDDKHRKELCSFKSMVMDLEASLLQVRASSKASVDAISFQLNEKMRALDACQVEMEKLQSIVATLHAKLQTSENSYIAKVSGLEADLSSFRGRLSHYEELVGEYKVQLGRSRTDQEELAKELRQKEQDMDRYKRESAADAEKCRLKLQHQLAEFEPLPDLLKSTESQLAESQEKLAIQEQRLADQNRMMMELRARLDQSNTTIDNYKERMHTASVDRKSMEARLTAAEHRQREVEEQSREMMAISGKKEEVVQRLPHRIEEQVQEIATLSAQVESLRVDARRQVEQAKDRAAGKERTHLARISDLETQLGRANNLATQFRKSKEELDRRYHSRVNELTERLDQAHSTKRSLENYITFLKSSYASVFSESGTHAPGSPLPPPTTFS